MRLRKYLYPLTVIFVVMAFCGCSYNPAEYYPLNEGDERTYLYTVDIVGGPNDGLHISMPIETFVFGKELVNGRQTIKMGGEPPNDDYFCWRIDLQGLKLCKLYRSMTNRYRIFKPPIVIFPSMFNVGDVYKRSYSSTIHSADDNTVVERLTGDTTVTFESVENVTVTAGPFEDCPKTSIVGTYDKESGGTYETSETVWFAHNVGMVKEIMIEKSSYLVGEDIEVTVTFELISATVDGITYE
jgi:hypothetical protein